VKNFSKDVADGENYTILLNQLVPDVCSRSPLNTKDLLERAEQVTILLSEYYLNTSTYTSFFLLKII